MSDHVCLSLTLPTRLEEPFPRVLRHSNMDSEEKSSSQRYTKTRHDFFFSRLYKLAIS